MSPTASFTNGLSHHRYRYPAQRIQPVSPDFRCPIASPPLLASFPYQTGCRLAAAYVEEADYRYEYLHL